MVAQGYCVDTQVRIDSSTVSGNRIGVSAERATIVNSLIDANLIGVSADVVRMESSSASNNTLTGLDVEGARTRVTVIESSIIGNGNGIDALSYDDTSYAPRGNLVLRNSIVSGNAGYGIDGNHVAARSNTEVSGNGRMGIYAFRASVRDSSITANGEYGLYTRGMDSGYRYFPDRVQVRRATITGNGLDGISSWGFISIMDSTVSGNRQSASCDVSTTCADITSFKKPQVLRTTCETSYSYSADWDICSLDPP